MARKSSEEISKGTCAQRTTGQLESAALDRKVVFGATPTEDAFAYGLSLIDGAAPLGSRYVVLITDGAPTYGAGCSGTGLAPVDTAPLIRAAAKAYSAGTKTLVIGLGTEEERAWMSELAVAGGTSSHCAVPTQCHYQIAAEADRRVALRIVLDDVASRTNGCIYAPLDGTKKLRAPSPSAILQLQVADAVVTVPLGNFAADCYTGAEILTSTNTVRLCSASCLAAGATGVERNFSLWLRQPCR